MPTRRRRGEGTIRRLANGKWQVKVSHGLDPATGRRRRASRTVATRREALELAAELRRDGAPSPAGKQRAGPYCLAALDSQRHRLRPSTHERYESLVGKWIAPHAPAVALADLTPQHVELWLGAIRDAGAGGRTVELCFVWLRKTFAAAADADVIRRNPVRGQHRPQHEPRRITPLTAAELVRLLEVARLERRNAALWPVLGVCGLREGEALGLSWSRVDLKAGAIVVDRTLVELDAGHSFGPPKTASAARTVHANAGVIDALRAHRPRAAGGADLVFATRDGGPLSRRNVRRSLHRLLVAAECPRIRVHDLRHTAATQLLVEQRLPAPVVARHLGHSVETLLRVYAHVLPGQADELRAAMDRIMG